MMQNKIFQSLITVFSMVLFIPESQAQFEPAAGLTGTSAMYKDSSAFIAWASHCSVVRGWQNITNTAAGYASAGDSTMAVGPAGTGGVVSLGDGGSATCRFVPAIRNGTGYDFAVFENSFSNNFLELAFVEVSTDGVNFFRFPATSYRQDSLQADSFDTMGEAKELNNLAGKYRGQYGTPFDLDELSGISGLDVSNIHYVKVIDVVGNIQNMYATYDQYGNAINDPWPTEFPTGGFDLDGIGVINNQLNAVNEEQDNTLFSFYPNPGNGLLYFSGASVPSEIVVYDVNGKIVFARSSNVSATVDLGSLQNGLYFISFEKEKMYSGSKLVIRH